MTPERLADLRACIEAGKSIGPVFTRELLAEVDRLTALVAERDAQLARYEPVQDSNGNRLCIEADCEQWDDIDRSVTCWWRCPIPESGWLPVFVRRETDQ